MRLLTRFLFVASIAIGAAGHATLAHADDRIDELAKTLSTSSSQKARLAAVTSLGRLGDKAALKPLVAALADPDSAVRFVAAAGLGKLGHKAALPALTASASEDTDADVRTRAKDSAQAIAKANKLPDPFPADKTAAAAAPASTKHGGKAGFGNEPRALPPQAEVYLAISSSTDDSPGKEDAKTRKTNADIVKSALLSSCVGNAAITTSATDAAKLAVPTRHVDLSVTKMNLTQNGNYVELEAQLRIAISDGNGKMLSFVSGAATVQVLKKNFKAKYQASMRKDALEGAMHGIFDKLISQIRKPANS